MARHSFAALGTTWWLELFEDINEPTLTTIFADCERFCLAYEARYSRFKTDSQISQLNRKKQLKNPSEELQSLLQFGKNMYLRSNTHFNFLLGHVLEARGYDADYSFTTKPLAETDQTPNPISDLQITAHEVTLNHGAVDLGGFGKGYLIDLLANRLQSEHDLRYFLINGGGDIYVSLPLPRISAVGKLLTVRLATSSVTYKLTQFLLKQTRRLKLMPLPPPHCY